MFLMLMGYEWMNISKIQAKPEYQLNDYKQFKVQMHISSFNSITILVYSYIPYPH